MESWFSKIRLELPSFLMDYPENLGILIGSIVDVSGETKKIFESLDTSISEKFYQKNAIN